MFDSHLIKEAAHSGLYSGVQSPLTSLAQLVDGALNSVGVESKIAPAVDFVPQPAPKEVGTGDWMAQQIGGGIGMILPFMATKGALKRCGLATASEAATVYRGSSLFSSGGAALVADGAISGFATDFLFRPVSNTSTDGLASQLWARTKNGTVGALTFGTLTAGSIGVRQLATPVSAMLKDAPTALRTPLSVLNNAAQGGLSGIPAGLVNADANALISHARMATSTERKESIASFVVGGATMTVLQSPLEPVSTKNSTNKIEQLTTSRNSHPAEATAIETLKFPSITDIQSMPPDQLPRLFDQNQRVLQNRIESLGTKMPWLAFHGAHSQRSNALFQFFKTGESHRLEYLFLASPTKIAPTVQSHIGDLAGSLRRATGYGGTTPETNIFVFDVHPDLIKEFYLKETPTSGPEPFAKSKYQGQNDGRLTDKIGSDELRLVTSLTVDDWAYKPELWGSGLPQSKWMEALSYQSALDKILGRIEQSSNSSTPRDWTRHDSQEAMLKKIAEMRREKGVTTKSDEDNDLIRNSPGHWNQDGA